MIRTVKAVVAKGDKVVALAEPGAGTATVILRSDDGGRSWLRTATALPDIRPETGALAASGDGFVLVPTGQRFPGPGVQVHCSPEGQNWTACGTIGPLSPAGSGVRGWRPPARGWPPWWSRPGRSTPSSPATTAATGASGPTWARSRGRCAA